jgi:hypothetical protein
MDAVALLGNLEIKVVVKRIGRVKSQSIQPGRNNCKKHNNNIKLSLIALKTYYIKVAIRSVKGSTEIYCKQN